MFLPAGTLVGQYGQVNGNQELTGIYTQGNQFSDQLTAVKVGPYTAKTGELLARALADNLDLEVRDKLPPDSVLSTIAAFVAVVTAPTTVSNCSTLRVVASTATP